MSHDCELCQMAGAYAEYAVIVPVDDTVSAGPQINVCRECLDEAQRYLEGLPEAIGFAEADPLTYGATR